MFDKPVGHRNATATDKGHSGQTEDKRWLAVTINYAPKQRCQERCCEDNRITERRNKGEISLTLMRPLVSCETVEGEQCLQTNYGLIYHRGAISSMGLDGINHLT